MNISDIFEIYSGISNNNVINVTDVVDENGIDINNIIVKYSQNEMIAIMTHDGLYDDGNAAYLKTWDKDRKLRNHMPLLLHQADHMASMIEFEIWNRGGVNASAPLVKNSAPIFKKKAPKISTANDNAQDLFKDLFGDTK